MNDDQDTEAHVYTQLSLFADARPATPAAEAELPAPSAPSADPTPAPALAPTTRAGARRTFLSSAGLFPPGEPLAPVPGLSGPDGSPRQWPYPVGYNIAQRPRATEQTSFEQLRNLAALFDGVQLWIQALQTSTRRERASRPQPGASDPPGRHGTSAGMGRAA